MWTRGEAFGWAWPPNVIERQDDELMNDLIQIAGASSLVREMLKNEKVTPRGDPRAAS